MPKANCSDISPLKILVIDDQLSQLKLMKSMLSRYGCQVVTVDSAEEAEQIIRWGERFSLIITDLRMPWLNGAQFCKRVKALHPELKVCALSGNLENFEEHELTRCGFDGVYQKPVSGELLREMLKHAQP